jgi:hypothetical protein
MVFNILILGIVLAVAYFHFAQGLFSAFISTVIAAIAAIVAVGFHEQVFAAIGKGGMADVSLGGVLIILFAATYLILRVPMDLMVPGNVNFGAIGDKVGAAICGLFAGMFTAGIIALAAQALPFGPSILGYSRWESETRHIDMGVVPDWSRVGRTNIADFLDNHEELKTVEFKNPRDTPPLDPAHALGLWIPVDDFVAGFVAKVSAGALSAEKTWSSVHPSYPNELFAARIGIQPGAKKTAFPINKTPQFDVVQIVRGPKEGFPNFIDGDGPAFRPRDGSAKIPDELKPGEGLTFVVIRVLLKHDAAEKDGNVRFSTASLRLVAGGKDYYPIGDLKDDETVVYQHPDDFLIVPADEGVDLVFAVDPEAFYGTASIPEKDAKVGPDVFLEFKRLSHIELGGKEVKPDSELLETDDDMIAKFRKSIFRRDGWAKADEDGGTKKKGKKK